MRKCYQISAVAIVFLSVIVCSLTFFLGFKNQPKGQIEQHVENCSSTSRPNSNADRIYVNNEQKYSTDDKFTIRVVAETNGYISSYSFMEEDIEVLSINKIDKKEIEIYLNAEQEYGKVSITVLLSAGKELSLSCFVIKNQYGVFFSENSRDDAYEEYYRFALNSKILTENEINIQRNDYYLSCMAKDNDEETGYSLSTKSKASANSNTKESKDTYVEGKIYWKDDKNALHNAKWVKVELYDENSPLFGDDWLGTAYTDTAGNYSITF